LGIWENFEEMEDKLTLNELEEILEAGREAEHRKMKFMAALKGIELDDPTPGTSFDEIKRKAEDINSGKTEEELVFEEIGISVVTVEE